MLLSLITGPGIEIQVCELRLTHLLGPASSVDVQGVKCIQK
jgi:hypothetical protein